jgi:hypothetical protein
VREILGLPPLPLWEAAGAAAESAQHLAEGGPAAAS